MQDYWQKQPKDKPLFPDMLWSRPENRAFAGKLLIAGGNEHGFVAPAAAFQAAEKAGIGTVRILLPESLKPFIGSVLDSGELAPATPSGSFSQRALAELLDMASWADGVLLAGDFGRNSETAIMLEKFIGKYHGQLTIAGDAVDYFLSAPTPILTRPDTLLALSFPQAQKLFTGARYPQALTHTMDRVRLVAALHDFTSGCQTHLLIGHHQDSYIAVCGQVSTTDGRHDTPAAIIEQAAAATVWWLQNPSKTFRALTTSLSHPS